MTDDLIQEIQEGGDGAQVALARLMKADPELAALLFDGDYDGEELDPEWYPMSEAVQAIFG